ncbi:MAG: DUF2167 domain-containing protein [Bacteroides sp.]|nr:DUF2167 domain-containing protein [Bacteroides sp.]
MSHIQHSYLRMILLSLLMTVLPTYVGAERFFLHEAPVNLDVPESFTFVNAHDAKEFLNQDGDMEVSTLNSIIGMIIPDSVLLQDYIDAAWILSYYDAGYVKDYPAADIDFEGIINNLRKKNPDKEVLWGLTPEYDLKHHTMSLPIVYLSAGDTIPDLRMVKFGKDGVLIVGTIATVESMQAMYESRNIISEGVEFKNGHRYEDFDPKKDKVAYETVAAFVGGSNGKATDTHAASGESSVNWSFIKWLGIIGGILLISMVLLMGLVMLTDKRVETSRSITRYGMNVLMRIMVFYIVYALLILLAVVLIWVGIKLTVGIFSVVVGKISVAIVIGMWMIIGGYALALVKSLFAFSSAESNSNIMEIKQNEAPELFEFIKSAASAVGKKMPGKVFLAPDVNAGVAYQHPVRSMFIPGKKDLTVGVALMYGLNRSEFKAIIAHEYGHFMQESMRIGPVVGAAMNIISRLSNSQQSQLTGLFVMPLLKRTALYVQRGFLRLSRAMEYEADETSASVVGAQVAISALIKTELNDTRFGMYWRIFIDILQYKQIVPKTLWNGYDWFLKDVEKFDGITLRAVDMVDKPLTPEVKKRVDIKNPWLSHPELSDRIDNIKRCSSSDNGVDTRSALELIPENLLRRMSEVVYCNINVSSAKKYSEDEYVPLMLKNLDEHTYPLRLRPFFSRRLSTIDLSTIDNNVLVKAESEIFTQENAELFSRYMQALEDFQIMAACKEGHTTETQLQYDGVVYSRKNIPLEQQEKYVRSMDGEVKRWDREIAVFAISKSDDPDRIIKAYNDIYYSYSKIDYLRNHFLPQQAELAKQLGSGGQKSDEEFQSIVVALTNYKTTLLRLLLYQIDLNRLEPVMHIEMLRKFNMLKDVEFSEYVSIEGSTVNYMFSITEDLIELFKALEFYSKKLITDTIEGKPLLLFWNNSVAAIRYQQEIEDKTSDCVDPQ